MKDQTWVILCRVSGLTRAEIVSGRLQAEGIDTRLEYEAVGRLYGITIDGLGEVKILIPRDLLEEARRVIAEDYSEADIPWKEE